MLEEYTAQTQNLMNDVGGQFFPANVLTNYINRARRRVAAQSGCVRVLAPGMQTIAGREKYPFHAWNAQVQEELPGAMEILAIRSVAVAIGHGPGAWKPAWKGVIWTDFQARFRVYNRAWRGTLAEPGFFSQFGFGTGGSLYLAPIPQQNQPMEVDASCMPFPLKNDKDPEPIPYPWTDCVPWLSLFFCLVQKQRFQDAMMAMELFKTEMPVAAAVVAPVFITNPYGTVIRTA